MISGMGGISGRLSDFVRLFFASINKCTDIVWILGSLFLKRFKEAIKMSIHQAEVFDRFSATFSPAAIKKWEAMVTAWNANANAPNPYQEPQSGQLLCP